MKLFSKEELATIAVIGLFFYLVFYAASEEYSNVEVPQQIKTEQQKTKENLNILLMDIANDLCKVDPKHSMVEVEYNGKVIDCK